MKKKSKIPFVIILTASLFPVVERILPWLAYRWFVQIFFSTARYELPPPEKEMISQASRQQINFEGKRIQVYEWGEGKPVLFVHGWMGRAAQFRKFIPVFVEAGFKVISFDATGHGLSDGKRSHLMEFATIVSMLKEKYGKFEMVVGHSLGGVASLHAVNDHKVTDKLTMIASPAVSEEIVTEFRKKIGATVKCEPYFYHYIKRTYGKDFNEYSASYIIADTRDIQLQLIYDENDKEVGINSAQLLKSKYPETRLITTQGLGHTRILKENEVIQSVLSFLKASTKAQIAD